MRGSEAQYGSAFNQGVEELISLAKVLDSGWLFGISRGHSVGLPNGSTDVIKLSVK